MERSVSGLFSIAQVPMSASASSRAATDTKAQLASVTAAQFWIKLMHTVAGCVCVGKGEVKGGVCVGENCMHLNNCVELVWVVVRVCVCVYGWRRLHFLVFAFFGMSAMI